MSSVEPQVGDLGQDSAPIVERPVTPMSLDSSGVAASPLSPSSSDISVVSPQHAKTDDLSQSPQRVISPPVPQLEPELALSSVTGSGSPQRSNTVLHTRVASPNIPSSHQFRRQSRILPINSSPVHMSHVRRPSGTVDRHNSLRSVLPIGPLAAPPPARDQAGSSFGGALAPTSDQSSNSGAPLPGLGINSVGSGPVSGSPPRKMSLGWFKTQGGAISRAISPSKSLANYDTTQVVIQRDFIMRRISANHEARVSRGEKAAEESQSGLRELQQNFAEIHRDDAIYKDVDWEFWTRVVQDYEDVARTEPRQLKLAIQSGFPAGLRALLWQVISGSKSPALEQMYSSLVDESSPHDKAIHKDLDRTSMAKEVNQESLFRVLKAYALFDPDVGYTQGMAFVAVPLLVSLSEYEAFCLFVQLMKPYNFRSLYLAEMPGLHVRLYQFERLIEDRFEIVHMHLKRQGVLASMYASQWFLTLFAYKFPLGLVQRIFDIVLAEGYEAVLRFSVALMQQNETKILALEFDKLLPFLKDNIFDSYIDRPNELVKHASEVELTPALLAKYELEYQEIHRLERERAEQMDNLRTSNTNLTVQLRQLEATHERLTREHVTTANELVQANIDNGRLKHENEELIHELKHYRLAQDNTQEVAELIRDKLQLQEVRKRLEDQIDSLQEALAAAMSGE